MVKQKEESLLVQDKKNGNGLKAVKGVDKDGNIITVPPKQKNESDFMRINQNSNPLENFFSNLNRKFLENADFSFFKVPFDDLEGSSQVLSELLKDESVNKDFIDSYRISPDDFIKEEKSYNPIDESKIDWEGLKEFGITREGLEASGSLEKMLNYQKSTVLVPITVNNGGLKLSAEVRLAFREKEDGSVEVVMHGIQSKPQLDRPFYGHTFTDDDKKNLLEKGNLGRIIDVKMPNAEKPIPVYVSVDKLTNQIVAYRADKIKIPNVIKGVTLDEPQKYLLERGRPAFVDGMTAKSGKKFGAYIQVNAEKKGLEFRFDTNADKKAYTQTNGGTKKEFTIPNKLGKVDLSEKQQTELKEGKTIYVSGMIDRKGVSYNAYVKVNDEKSKLNFYKWNPDKSQDVKPDANSKTQVAVNSEGKTNEATKDVKEPLKENQVAPKETQQQHKRGRGI